MAISVAISLDGVILKTALAHSQCLVIVVHPPDEIMDRLCDLSKILLFPYPFVDSFLPLRSIICSATESERVMMILKYENSFCFIFSRRPLFFCCVYLKAILRCIANLLLQLKPAAFH